MELKTISDTLRGRNPHAELTPSGPYLAELGKEIEATQAAPLVKMGLHVLNDDLDSAHGLAQSLEGNPTADYWHAIVHRREGDYGNAKYWFARVGAHPVIIDTYGDTQSAAKFVDECRAARGDARAPLVERQWQEMLSLLDYSEGKR